MRRSAKVSYEWKGARAMLDRLAKANALADETWLRSLSIDESALILEDLCRGIPELRVTSELDPPPVVLWRLWRSEEVPAATFADLFRAFYGLLESLDVEYFAYGGVVVAVWGAPRETVDVDAVACVADDDIEDLFRALARAGFTYPEEARQTFPIDGWLRARLHGRHADITLGRTPFDESALTRRRRVKLFGREIWVASAEDLILYKLVAHRFKDLGDAETVLVRQRGKLDLAYLRKWADEIARGTGKFEVPGKLEDLIQRIQP